MSLSIPNVAAAAAASTTFDPHQHLFPSYLVNNILSDPNTQFQQIPINFTRFRSSKPDHGGSPDDLSSRVSEQEYFGSSEDETHSSSPCLHSMSPHSGFMDFGGNEYLMGSMADFTISGGSLFVASSPTSSFSSSMASSFSTATSMPQNLATAPVVQTSSSSATQPIRVPTGRAVCQNNHQKPMSGAFGHYPYPEALAVSSSFSSSYSPSSAIGGGHFTMASASTSFASTTPAMLSPLKKHQYSQAYLDDDDDSDLPDEEEERKASFKKRKRVRKVVTKTTPKQKPPKETFYCKFTGCKVTCSSIPSLNRHEVGHNWRGQFSPVRCEACQSSLSNEFSVQRHILRSSEDSRCRRMRIYSIMKSENEIEKTVRFFPLRPHGKKTIKVNDLEKKRAKFFPKEA
ncbi:hypothetical protein BGX24_012349 [Mortierella sp. AD032]|nr:hypothetical protein BGX24_012349 [Mortierella sp. AD032]